MTTFSLIPLAFAFVSGSLVMGQDHTVTFRPLHSFGPTVTGAPYCADDVREFQQTLNDGTHIDQTTTQDHICRDSAGRVRIERDAFTGSGSGASPKVVQILDPVAGVEYTLDTQRKIAHRVTISAPVPQRRARAAQAIQRGEPLGTRTIGGVTAQGTLDKTVLPVNSQGNDRPITTTVERWESPELQILVLTKRSDPRRGDSINRVENLTTGPPDPSLFQVPPDYQVVNETGDFNITYSTQ